MAQYWPVSAQIFALEALRLTDPFRWDPAEAPERAGPGLGWVPRPYYYSSQVTEQYALRYWQSRPKRGNPTEMMVVWQNTDSRMGVFLRVVANLNVATCFDSQFGRAGAGSGPRK
jgi:hypothetical protein